MQIYLRQDLPLVNGHAIYIDSEWALTSISQRQFWRERGLLPARRRHGRRGPVDRHLRVAARRAGARQGRREVHGARRSRGGLGAAARSPRRPTGRRGRARLVPRPGHHVPEPLRRRERRAAAGQHPGLVGGPARTPPCASRTCSWPPTTCARTPTWPRWRAPTRRPGGRRTRSWELPGRPLRGAASGRSRSPRCSNPPGCWTACCGSCTGRRGLRCGRPRRARSSLRASSAAPCWPRVAVSGRARPRAARSSRSPRTPRCAPPSGARAYGTTPDSRPPTTMSVNDYRSVKTMQRGPPHRARDTERDIYMSEVHRVAVEIGGTEISFETGKMAKQASGAVVVERGRHHGPRHRHGRQPARRRLPPADGGRRGAHVRRGQDPRLVLQARGPCRREGAR